MLRESVYLNVTYQIRKYLLISLIIKIHLSQGIGIWQIRI